MGEGKERGKGKGKGERQSGWLVEMKHLQG